FVRVVACSPYNPRCCHFRARFDAELDLPLDAIGIPHVEFWTLGVQILLLERHHAVRLMSLSANSIEKVPMAYVTRIVTNDGLLRRGLLVRSYRGLGKSGSNINGENPYKVQKGSLRQ